jgi:phosphoesterase RecJ-like protein
VSGLANGAESARDAVLRALREGERFVLVTHENPDGDALGSLVAMHGVLEALGKDVAMFVAPDEFPLPYEYAWLPLEHLISEVPEDLAERTVVFLDCGNIDRNPVEVLRAGVAQLLNIDHHHDNTRFGTIDYVVPEASCTAEIVWDLMRALGVTPTVEVAEALYVGLVTDTGRFMYENTTARAHEMAAAVIRAGVDVHEVYRRLYERVPPGKLTLLARGLENLRRYEDGRLTLSQLSRRDFEESDAPESFAEGVVDHLRALEDTAVAGLIRELDTGTPDVVRKVSLRATDDRVDVSRIARAMGGGGHRRAAGFSTQLAPAELVDFLRREVRAQL